MAVLRKADVPDVALEREEVPVPEWGGEVVVQSLMLRDRLQLAISNGQPAFAQVAEMLARSVVDADGEQIKTAAQWEAFGAKHFDTAITLFAKAKQLSGLGDEKKEEAPSGSDASQ
jgi:hypothetical protein